MTTPKSCQDVTTPRGNSGVFSFSDLLQVALLTKSFPARMFSVLQYRLEISCTCGIGQEHYLQELESECVALVKRLPVRPVNVLHIIGRI